MFVGFGWAICEMYAWSHTRDLGVWMFPGVRRVLFLLAIVLKLNAVFVPFFFFFLNHMIIVLRYKILHAADAIA